MKILITGVAGFIGFHLAQTLIKKKYNVIGVDNINSYYDISLKQARLDILDKLAMPFTKLDLSNYGNTKSFFISEKPDFVINLAAQAGVRNSLIDPHAYVSNNISGFLNVLEGCKDQKVKHLIFASSSSVYGQNNQSPFNEVQNVDYPKNLYAVSKKTNELMAYSYSSLFNISTTGLRFFTVYGPWGRPDMAYFKFVKNIFENKPIDVYGHGKMFRDFTYIDDIINGIVKLFEKSFRSVSTKTDVETKKSKSVPYQIFNIGNSEMVNLNYFIEVIEEAVGKKAKKNYLEMQLGDMDKTSANIDKIKDFVGFQPSVSINKGIPLFVKWYKQFYNKI